MSCRPLTPEQPKSRALVCRVRLLSLNVVLKFSPGGRVGALLVGQAQQIVGAGVVELCQTHQHVQRQFGRMALALRLIVKIGYMENLESGQKVFHGHTKALLF